MTSPVGSRWLAVVLIVAGVAATLAGLYGQVFLGEDEGHHDGREFTFASESAIGADELVVTSPSDNVVTVEILRAGQPIGLDEVHGADAHVYLVDRDLSSYAHVVVEELVGPVSLDAPAGDLRVVAQVAPSSGADFVELGADVAVAGEPADDQDITTTDEWTDGDITIRREFFDFVLSAPWNGEEVFDGPALLTMFRADDLSFVHAHAELVENTRFSFSVNLPDLGEYLAALEFEQDGELVTALFRFTL